MKLPLVAASLFLGLLADAAFAEPIAFQSEQNHPNGTSVTMQSLEWSETEMLLGVRIVNAHDQEVRLASAPRRTYIEAAEDNRLLLVPPDDNAQLAIPARSTVEGNLVFMGSVPASGEMTLVLNETGNSAPNTPTPRFDITIPAEVIEAAASKKN